jgi:hypothetical protein
MERCRFAGPVDRKKDWLQPTIAGRPLKSMSHGSVSSSITFIKVVSALHPTYRQNCSIIGRMRMHVPELALP